MSGEELARRYAEIQRIKCRQCRLAALAHLSKERKS